MAGLFAERIRLLPGDRGRPHTHSGELHVTVVRGRIFLNWGTRLDTTGARRRMWSASPRACAEGAQA